MLTLLTPIEQIPRIGQHYQKRLKRLGIRNVGDIIFHFPHRYEDFSNLVKIADVKEGGPASAEASSGKPFCFQGKVLEVKNVRTFRKKMVLTQVFVGDETGKLKVVWFNQPYLISTFKKGDYLCLAGKITKKSGQLYLSSPAYEKIPDPKDPGPLGYSGNSPAQILSHDLTHTGRLIPVYPETEGLSSKWLRFIVKPILSKLKNQIPDPLPEKVKRKFDFLPIKEAVWQIHFPDNLKLAQEAKKRFVFEELFKVSLFALTERLKLAKEKALELPVDLELMKKFVKKLPFKLTDAQKKAVWQILKDMEKPRPMNRLLEGDVGSGKTVVAAMAMLNAAAAGFQSAFMAPTEILAKQHFETLKEYLNNFGISLGFLTGKKKIKGDQQITVGTHALIQEGVKFKNLALVVVDEQHRFGVEQRAKLMKGSRRIPHLLSMTATPIPRTLALTVFGDLDLSQLNQLPSGRKKIITKIVRPQNKQATYEFIREKVKEGRQVFVICPRIEKSEIRNSKIDSTPPFRKRAGQNSKLSWLDVKAVKEEHEKLSKEIFPDLKIGMLHGKMKTKEKEQVMNSFKAGEIDVLVSTSVVEVGIDIPNAAVIMIEGSERFGLAQLHQFRGRVGRAGHQSWCFLFTDSQGITVNKRLQALISCEDGFELAEKDLQIRGPGDFTGQRQWGIPDLAMASLKDTAFVEKARKEAKDILTEDPELKKYPLLLQKIREFGERVHLE